MPLCKIEVSQISHCGKWLCSKKQKTRTVYLGACCSSCAPISHQLRLTTRSPRHPRRKAKSNVQHDAAVRPAELPQRLKTACTSSEAALEYEQKHYQIQNTQSIWPRFRHGDIKGSASREDTGQLATACERHLLRALQLSHDLLNPISDPGASTACQNFQAALTWTHTHTHWLVIAHDTNLETMAANAQPLPYVPKLQANNLLHSFPIHIPSHNTQSSQCFQDLLSLVARQLDIPRWKTQRPPHPSQAATKPHLLPAQGNVQSSRECQACWS